MDKAFNKQAQEWFERGRHDIETAQLLYDERGYADSIAYHVQQAIEKYLKGYLVLHGKKPPRIHELDTLLNHIGAFVKKHPDITLRTVILQVPLLNMNTMKSRRIWKALGN